MVINKEGAHCTVSVDGHTEVGHFELRLPWKGRFSDKTSELWGVGIDKEFRGKGYAHVLMQDVEQEAMNMSASCVWLNVMAGNRVALHVYEMAGFHVVSTRFDRHWHFTPEGHALVDAAYVEFKKQTNWGNIPYDEGRDLGSEYRDYVEAIKETHITWHECRPDVHEMVKYL